MELYQTGKNAAELAWLRAVAQSDAAQQTDYRTYREFYDGKHDVPLTARQKQYLQTKGIDFRSNYLRLPVQVLAQRFKVIGFSIPGEADGPKKLGEEDGLLWRWWSENRMDGVQNNVHEANAVDGDTFILIEWDDVNSRPIYYHERAYDGDEGVKMHYTEAARRKPLFATKRWRSVGEDGSTHRRMNIYATDAIYRYWTGTDRSQQAGWQRFEEEGKAWPEPWPLDFLPVIPFRHNDDGSNWGRSELEDLISDQEGLNKAVLDVLEGGDRTAFQIVTLNGGLAQNKDGSPIEITHRQVLSHKTGTWGHIPAGDLMQLRELRNDFVIGIAQKSQIPLQYFQITGQIASAQTQAADDSNLVAKAEWYSVPVGNSWEDVMIASVKMANHFSNMGLSEEENISVQWDTFERVDRFAIKTKQSELVERLVRSGASLKGALMFAEIDPEIAEAIMITDVVDGIEQ